MARSPTEYKPNPNNAKAKPARRISFAASTQGDDSEAIEEVENEFEGDDDHSSDALDIRRIIEDFHKRHEKKIALHSAAFDKERKGLYADALKRGKELRAQGIAFIEQRKHAILTLKADEMTLEEYLGNIVPTMEAEQKQLDTLFSLYAPAFETAFPQRRDAIDAASKMVQENPGRRDKSLHKLKKHAYIQLDESRRQADLATNATNLIKAYKTMKLW